MAITFAPLRAVLLERGLNLNYLRKPRAEGGLGLSSCTTNNISHDQPVTFEVVDTICRDMGLAITDVIRYYDGPFKKTPPRNRNYDIRYRKQG